MKKVVLSGVFILLGVAMALAVPQFINYQGVLRDNSGNLITGSKAMTFRIFDDAVAGSKLFEMTTTEAVSNGLYTASLGPLGYAELGSGRRWLEVVVGSDTLSPRLEILSVAYAVTAASAETAANLNGYTAAASGVSIIPTTDTGGKLSPSVIPATGITADYASYATLSGTATMAASAASAGYATLSGTASTAASAASADYATLSGNASYATLSGTASTAADADSAVYATLSATATNASTVNNIRASVNATANRLLPLDGNKQLKGMSVSTEAVGGNPYSLFVNSGKIGINTSSPSFGSGTLPKNINHVDVSNTSVTANSVIFLSITSGTAGASDQGGLRVSSITAGSGFRVTTMTGTGSTLADIPFYYLMIN